MTFTDDGTSFVGDHEIIKGTASVTFSNEAGVRVTFGAFRYDTGSDDLAEELAFLQEGESGVPSGRAPTGNPEWEFLDGFEPGSHTWTTEFRPGTYIFDAAAGDETITGMWRAAVVEVSAD